MGGGGEMQLKDPKSDLRRRLLTCTALVAVCTWAPLNAASAQVNVVANGTTVDLSFGNPLSEFQQCEGRKRRSDH